MGESLTPMMAQYKATKEQYKDCIVLFRLGDFYEMFFEDALIGSKILGITLTSRTKGEGVRVPMCGVPFHAVDNYIAKLTRAGKKVAMCDQITEPNGKTLVERSVVRVITPGTTLDDNILNKKTNNYLACIVHGYDGFGFAYADVTTGDFFVSEFKNFDGIESEIARVTPAEIIVPSSLLDDVRVKKLYAVHSTISIFPYDLVLDPRAIISDHFGVKALQVFGLENKESGVFAAASLYEYLKETQKTALSHIEKISWKTTDDFMPLSNGTMRNLEIFSNVKGDRGSLVHVIDKTLTAMGGRRLRNWMIHPLKNVKDIENRLDAVNELLGSASVLKDIRGVLVRVLDIERILSRLSLGASNARDLVALKESLLIVPELKRFLSWFKSKFIGDVFEGLIELPQLIDLLDRAIIDSPPAIIREGGMIKNGFNPELDELRLISTEGKTFISEMQKREIERTGISSLKIKYNKVFGYYIEISKSNLKNVPMDYIRKQTLVNAERFITPELKEYEDKVLNSMERICELEYRIFEDLRKKVLENILDIKKIAESISLIDVVGGFSELALNENYCRPEISNENVINIKGGRHPIVESLNLARKFVPNDCFIDGNKNVLNLITGPNMGGKSVYIKQVALITYMAHIGCFVPAAKCQIGLVDEIFTRVGAHDNLSLGESTFMVEMMEAATILQKATDRSLIILDEIGRGTSTYDGVSIAWAICEYIHDHLKSKTLFATHYHELITLIDKLESGKNFSVAVSEKPANSADGHAELVFLYKVVEGGINKSYGIEVAKLAGLPKLVIMKARGVLEKLEEGIVDAGIKNHLASRAFSPNKEQIAMFDERDHKALEELRAVDTDRLTPIEALNKIHDLKEKGLL